MSRDARRSYDGVVPRYTPNHARAATDTASQQPTKAPSTGFKCASNARSRRKTARQEALTSSHRAIVLPTHHPRHPRAHGFVQTHAHFQKTQKNTENTATQRVVSSQPPLVPARGLATCQQRGLDPRDHPRLPAAAHPRYAVHRPNSISHDHGTAGWVAARSTVRDNGWVHHAEPLPSPHRSHPAHSSAELGSGGYEPVAVLPARMCLHTEWSTATKTINRTRDRGSLGREQEVQ